ncbi:unnamed protein product [Bemisia tabaci]|uniref:Homeobox domain-containing protein n=1 Tax=Bemisia tabaci TaxID=7038 RepID=A0A9P0AA00_BEMTA|nr:unnamed protein product [Bemisia tabaci]
MGYAVWFQNARAKWRRMMVKQEGGSNKSGDKSDSSNSAIDTVYHHNVSGMSSPQHYMSSSPLECSS